MISFNLRKIFGTILLCSMLAYIFFGLSASWMRISNGERNISIYFDRQKTVSNIIDLCISVVDHYKPCKFRIFLYNYVGSRIYRLVQKTFSPIYKKCGQISQFFIGGETKAEKFLISVGKFQIFLIFTTATNTGKLKGQEMEHSSCMPPTMMSGRFQRFQ